MNRWLFGLLLAIPVALVAEVLHAPPLVLFGLAAVGLVPLAGIIGMATEVLAERVGPRIGGLLNATFGNAAEIIIGLAALAAGLPDVVRASITGSIVGNTLLVLGMAMVVGGWRHGVQRFDARAAGQYAALFALVVVGLAIPALLHLVGEGAQPGTVTLQDQALEHFSIIVSIVLLLCYLAYLAFAVFGLHAGASDALSAHASTEKPSTHTARKLHVMPPLVAFRRRTTWGPWLAHQWQHTLWLPIAILAMITALTAITSEMLVGTIEPVAHQVHLSPFFVGLIILPIVGNAAEHLTAVTMAAKNQMDVALAITAGSSIQVALLVAPLLVLVSPLLGATLSLNFTALEIAVFALVAGLFTVISLDGESTWFEGVLLCAFYLILAAGIFITPV